MTQAYTDQDKAIALIGIYQVAQQVYQLATSGKTDEIAYQTSINSLFCENPDDTLDVFGGDVQNIQLGVNTLLAQMSSNESVSARNIEVTKYVLSLMILEKMSRKRKGLLIRFLESLNPPVHKEPILATSMKTSSRRWRGLIRKISVRLTRESWSTDSTGIYRTPKRPIKSAHCFWRGFGRRFYGARSEAAAGACCGAAKNTYRRRKRSIEYRPTTLNRQNNNR